MPNIVRTHDFPTVGAVSSLDETPDAGDFARVACGDSNSPRSASLPSSLEQPPPSALPSKSRFPFAGVNLPSRSIAVIHSCCLTLSVPSSTRDVCRACRQGSDRSTQRAQRATKSTSPRRNRSGTRCPPFLSWQSPPCHPSHLR